jgi:hypothetical protein
MRVCACDGDWQTLRQTWQTETKTKIVGEIATSMRKTSSSVSANPLIMCCFSFVCFVLCCHRVCVCACACVLLWLDTQRRKSTVRAPQSACAPLATPACAHQAICVCSLSSVRLSFCAWYTLSSIAHLLHAALCARACVCMCICYLLHAVQCAKFLTQTLIGQLILRTWSTARPQSGLRVRPHPQNAMRSAISHRRSSTRWSVSQKAAPKEQTAPVSLSIVLSCQRRHVVSRQ